MGRQMTQSLILEFQWNEDLAVYTITDEDKEFRGKFFPSLRKLYFEISDPTEYEFALTCFLSWDQWKRISENKAFADTIEKWREELEVKLRSDGVRAIIKQAPGSFNAAKWTADGHWNVKRGRPSKEEQKREKRIRERVSEETAGDAARVLPFMRKDNNG